MKITSAKAMLAKGMVAGLLMGAVALAAPAKAQAQVVVGVQFGRPAYPVVPAYAYDRAYYERLRCERERREAWLRHEAWEREHHRDYRYYR
jgi:hypothetical protein